MREGERERRRATHDLAGGGVLRAVARADVLELGAVPRDDAAQVRACGEEGREGGWAWLGSKEGGKWGWVGV